ncbi:MAG: thioredoxin-dependent thiol peroxidase [Candidatus Nitrosocosmicus sp.]
MPPIQDTTNKETILKEGEKPFNFSFYDTDGKNHELKDILGKKNIVVYFYPKDFPPGCTVQAEEFTESYSEFKKSEIEIIGISPDSEESHIKFRQKMHIPYMLTSDTDNTISKKYGVYGLKKFMGKEYYGVDRSTFLIGKNGKIVKIFHKVKPAGHSQEVLKYFTKKEV